MANSWFKFLKGQIADQNTISTGSELLDRVYKIPIGSYSLFRCEPYSGGTALLLQLVAELTSKDYIVVYADINDSLLKNRLHGVNLHNLQVIKPTEGLEIVETAKALGSRAFNAVYILDNYNFIQDNYSLKQNVAALAMQIKTYDPNATIIASQRKGVANDIWSKVVDVAVHKNIYDKMGEENLIGHQALVSSGTKKEIVYIEHKSGRLSKGYEIATLLVEKGNSPSGMFSHDGISVRGFHNFIEEYDNAVQNS